METTWQKLDMWLRANAPEAFPSLNGPATEGEIAAIEEATSLTFPPSLRASYLAHDGEAADSNGLFECWQLLPLSRVREHWEEFVQLAREYGNRHLGDGKFMALSSIPVMWFESEIRYIQVTPGEAEGALFELPRHGPPLRLADNWEAYLQEQMRRINLGELVVDPDFGFNLLRAGDSTSGA
jgi:hypothetical protein